MKLKALPHLCWPVAVVSASLALPASAMSADEFVHVSLMEGWRLDDGRHVAGLRIELTEGWHTYWRQPGEAGIPPVLDLSGSRNVRAAGIVWPTPELFEQNGMTTVGYEGTLILPVMIETVESGPVHLSGQLFLGACEEVCIPVDVQLSGTLPDGGAPDPEIQASVSDQPVQADQQGRARAECAPEPISDGLNLTVFVDPGQGSAPDHLVIETGDPSIWASEPVVHVQAGEISATTELVPASAKPFLLSRADVLVTLFQDGKVLEYRGCDAR